MADLSDLECDLILLNFFELKSVDKQIAENESDHRSGAYCVRATETPPVAFPSRS